VTIRVRAPATTANVGPGFDCAGIALELWNELEVEEGGEGGAGQEHLGVRAFALLASPAGRSFRFTTPIPQKRGLGSSASVIALGLVAGALAAGEEPDPERLLALGVPLEGHADNLAACLAGGVCLTWEGRIARVAEAAPLAPVAVVPQASEVSTAEARASLPAEVAHADAAFTAARAALLGAAVAGGDAELFAAALADRLHEPYRARTAPLFEAIRAEPPAGARGLTISGSGPTVIVWADHGAAEGCAAALAERFPDARALALRVSPRGAGPR
jgi:homoserine kinase